MTAVYTRRVTAQLRDDATSGAGAVEVAVELSWRRADPLAVEARFRAGARRPVLWLFALDLLAAGLVDEVGHGDVVVGPRPDAIELRLSVMDESARLWFTRRDVELFLSAVDVVMGPVERDTTVALAVDAAIADLLTTGGAA